MDDVLNISGFYSLPNVGDHQSASSNLDGEGFWLVAFLIQATFVR